VPDESQPDPAVAKPSPSDKILATCGYLFVAVAVSCFAAIVYLKVHDALHPTPPLKYDSVLDFVQRESATLSLLFIAFVASSTGKRLLTTTARLNTRTIPIEDLPLIQDAVKAGNADPIDQYMRLRSLTGISGNFAKLGVTGLPLTTVFLTLVFALIALLPRANPEIPKAFLDLAKLTLGAFIGSFVQGRVEQRKQQAAMANGQSGAKGDLIA
jgi:hypothetical protein